MFIRVLYLALVNWIEISNHGLWYQTPLQNSVCLSTWFFIHFEVITSYVWVKKKRKKMKPHIRSRKSRAGHDSATSSLQVNFFLSMPFSGPFQLCFWLLGQWWIHRWRLLSHRSSRWVHHIWGISRSPARRKNPNCQIHRRRKRVSRRCPIRRRGRSPSSPSSRTQ